ncbi:MAG: hypothetical protein ACXWCR_11500 [Flavitalea sp.]
MKAVLPFIKNLFFFFVGFNIFSLIIDQKFDLTLSTFFTSIVCALVILPFESLKKELHKGVKKNNAFPIKFIKK